jgi:hypothetical protein
MLDLTIISGATHSIMARNKKNKNSILFYKLIDEYMELTIYENDVMLVKHNSLTTVKNHIKKFLTNSQSSAIAVAIIEKEKMSKGSGEKIKNTTSPTYNEIDKILNKAFLKLKDYKQ